jgi:hypothetical protein
MFATPYVDFKPDSSRVVMLGALFTPEGTAEELQRLKRVYQDQFESLVW